MTVYGFITRSRRASRRRAALFAAASVVGAASVFGSTQGLVGVAWAAAATTPAASVSCMPSSAAVYHVDGLGQLRRWSFASPLDGAADWTQQQIGTGWNGLTVFSGGRGVLYTVDSAGLLRWYRDQGSPGGGASWDPSSGRVIGNGWNTFTHVFSAGQGVIYAVDPAGNLHWYRFLGTGASGSWAEGSGTVVGPGWSGFPQVFAGGNGVVYAVDTAGALDWYQDLTPTDSAFDWANGGRATRIGTGWSHFTRLASAGGGVIFAYDPSGGLWWYRHLDPLGGSATWANGGIGVGEGTGWNPNPPVADVAACSAA
jgi:hypothetical protein